MYNSAGRELTWYTMTGKHVVFGKVIRGYEEVVKEIEKVPVDQKDRPSVPVVIANCGELVLKAKVAPKGPSMRIII